MTKAKDAEIRRLRARVKKLEDVLRRIRTLLKKTLGNPRRSE